MAVVCSIKHHHHYLLDRRIRVRSEHGSLRWLTNFKICEDALARILETLLIYDFFVEHRPGLLHRDADSISLRPCVDQKCVHCERFEKKYSENSPGLATRNIVSGESVTQGESKTKTKCQKLNGHVPSGERLDKMRMCSEEGLLQTQSSTNAYPNGGSEMLHLPIMRVRSESENFHP